MNLKPKDPFKVHSYTFAPHVKTMSMHGNALFSRTIVNLDNQIGTNLPVMTPHHFNEEYIFIMILIYIYYMMVDINVMILKI